MPAHGEHLALQYADWPEVDRQAWEAALRPATLFGAGTARKRTLKTLAQMCKGYALWLGSLQRYGLLVPELQPGERLTERNLRVYLDELQARVSPQTTASRFNDLNAAIAMIDPTADRTLVNRGLRKLQKRARPSRDKRARMITPEALLQAGIRRMDRVESERHAKRDVQAGRYRDGLIMVILACRPIRLGTLALMELGRHLTKRGDSYVINFDESETKGDREQEEELPAVLTRYIDRYLEHYRPMLRRGHQCDAVWISTYRAALSEQSHYLRFRAATKEETGVELCPHLTRDIAATGTATERPDLVGLVPLILDHADARTAQLHYNHARKIDASRVYGAELLGQIATALADQED